MLCTSHLYEFVQEGLYCDSGWSASAQKALKMDKYFWTTLYYVCSNTATNFKIDETSHRF